jgi:integrase/recombinase XerC
VSGSSATTDLARDYAGANGELIKSFCRYCVARGLAVVTIRAYREAAESFVESLGGQSVVSADHLLVREWIAGLHSRQVTSNTIRLRMCALRSFCRFVTLTGLTNRDPTLLIQRIKQPGRKIPRVLTVPEIEKLIAAGRNPLERAVLEFFYSTGVRISELISMRLENVDFRNRVARVIAGKGNKDRPVLFGEKCKQALLKYLKWRPSRAGYLFEASGCGTSRRPYTTRAIANIVTAAGVRAGLGRIHCHMLRRAFATHLLQGGANLRVLQELLGHERLSTTQLYTVLSIGDLKNTHTKTHPHAGSGNE